MEIMNLTPHAIVVRTGSGDISFQPSGVVARVDPGDWSESEPLPNGIPVGSSDAGAVVGLPEPAAGVTYIVSSMVLDALSVRREDVLAPATGPNDGAIRNDAGHIVAVTRLRCKA